MKTKPLIIGIGNADRQDDGAGWHVLKILAEKLGYTIPDDPGAALEIENDQFDLLYDLQIYPELAQTISEYTRVCFVDAHTADVPEPISWSTLLPEYERSPLTHHMSPQTVLSITEAIYGTAPKTVLVSIRGYSFQFERELSPKTALLTQQAADRIWNWAISSPSRA